MSCTSVCVLNHDKDKAKEMRTILHYAIDFAAYPWKQIDVVIEILCDDGGAFAAAVNAAGLALQDANIRFRQKLTACTAAAYESDGVEYLLRDLNIMEELEVNFTTAVVLEPSGFIPYKLHGGPGPAHKAENQPHSVLRATVVGCRAMRMFLDLKTRNYFAKKAAKRNRFYRIKAEKIATARARAAAASAAVSRRH